MRSRRASSTGRVTRAGTPTTSEPGGTRAPSGTTAPAATTLPVAMWTPLRSTLPMPIKQSSSMVHPCRMARCPTPTRAPIRAGSPSSTCTIVPSWRLVRSPTTIAAMSPRSTAPYHTLACAPSVTSPNTTAPGAINAVGWMLMLLPHRLEYPLDPRVYGLAVPLSGVPAQGLRHVQRLVVERVEVGGSEHARLQRRALLGDMDQQNGLAREYGRVRGHGNARQRQRQRTSVETEMVLIVGGPILVARLDPAGPHGETVRAGRHISLRAPKRHPVERDASASGQALEREVPERSWRDHARTGGVGVRGRDGGPGRRVEGWTEAGVAQQALGECVARGARRGVGGGGPGEEQQSFLVGVQAGRAQPDAHNDHPEGDAGRDRPLVVLLGPGPVGDARQRRGGGGRHPDPRERGDGFRGGRREPDRGEAAARLERLDEIVRALKPLVGGLRHHLSGDFKYGTLIVGLERRGGNLLHDVLVADRERVLAVERHATGEALIRDHTEGIDVGASVERLGAGLLRAHVMWRADGHPGARELAARRRLRDAEIGDDGQPVLVEHDVVRLDVAVHDAAFVRVGQGARHLHQDLPDLRRGERAARGQHGRQRLAAQELHHEIDHAAGLADAIDRDDARVLELGGRLGFPLEPLDELLVEREGERQDLDRHIALQLFFARLEDNGHPAAAQLLEDLVLVVQLLPHQIQLRRVDLLVAHAGHRSRGRQIQSAGAAELAGVVVLGAAAGAVHQFSEGSRKLRDWSDDVSTHAVPTLSFRTDPRGKRHRIGTRWNGTRDTAPRAQKSEASAAYSCGRRAPPDGGATSGCAIPTRTDNGKS